VGVAVTGAPPLQVDSEDDPPQPLVGRVHDGRPDCGNRPGRAARQQEGGTHATATNHEASGKWNRRTRARVAPAARGLGRSLGPGPGVSLSSVLLGAGGDVGRMA